MERKVLLLTSLVALLVLGLTSAASAAWTHKGKGELKENASVTLEGTLTLSTSAGNVACTTEIGTTLTASSSSGHVNSFTVSKPSECDLTGSLAAICGTNGLTKVEKTGTWALTADENDITLTSIDVHYALAGCLIPGFWIKGSSTISLDKTTAIGKATPSGTQTLYNALGEESGTAELKGTLNVSPAGTYGTKTAASVETKWTMGDEYLSEDGKPTLTGTFSFSGADGSVSCLVTVNLLLESSTIEEEEPEGEIESFTVAEPSKCDLGGTYKTACGTNAVSKVEQTGTATLTTDKKDISVSGLVLDYKFEKCAITSLRVEGNPTLSVASTHSINEATFSAGGLQVYNSGGELTDTATASGSSSVSPSGTFQLTSKAAHEASTHAAATHAEYTSTHAAHTHVAETHAAETIGTETPPSGIPEWHHNGSVLAGEAGPQELHLVGELSSFLSSFQSGPCEVTFEGEAWNENEMADGVINGGEIQGSCATSAAGCTVSPTLQNFPWTLTGTEVTGELSAIEIVGMQFETHYVGGGSCPLPVATIMWTGTATGVAEIEGCISFEEHQDDLLTHAPLPTTSINLQGSLCDTTLYFG